VRLPEAGSEVPKVADSMKDLQPMDKSADNSVDVNSSGSGKNKSK